MPSPTQIGNITEGHQSGSNSFTKAYEVPSTGSNKLLLVFVSNNCGSAPTVTYNGVSMTEAAKNTVAAFAYLNVFYLVNPPSGSHNIVVSLQSSDQVGILAITLQDAAQTSPVDGSGQNSSGSAVTSRGVTFSTSVDNSLVLLFTHVDIGATNPVQGDGQTEVYTGDSWRTTSIFNIASIPKSTAGSITPTLSWTTAKQVENVAFGIKLAPPVAPTVTTQAASSVASTSFTGNGNITDTGGANATRRGFAYKTRLPSTLSSGMISYWKLDETAGSTTAVDAVGTNTLAKGGSATFAAGKINNGVDLEAGTSDYLAITNAAQTGLDITGDFTIGAWIKVESTPGAGVYYPIVAKGVTIGNRGYYFEYHKSGGGTERLGCLISDDGSSASEHYKAFAPTTGVWYHVAMTYDVSAGTAEFFVNGSSLGTVAGGKTSIYNNAGEFHIGENEGAYFDGLIDEVCFWNRVLSSAEITTLYNFYSDPTTSDSVAYDDGDFGTGAFTKTIDNLNA